MKKMHLFKIRNLHLHIHTVANTGSEHQFKLNHFHAQTKINSSFTPRNVIYMLFY